MNIQTACFKSASRWLVRNHLHHGRAVVIFCEPDQLAGMHIRQYDPVGDVFTRKGRVLLEKRDVREMLWQQRRLLEESEDILAIWSRYDPDADLSSYGLCRVVLTSLFPVVGDLY